MCCLYNEYSRMGAIRKKKVGTYSRLVGVGVAADRAGQMMGGSQQTKLTEHIYQSPDTHTHTHTELFI